MVKIERFKSNSQQKEASSTPPLEQVITEDGILCLISSFLTLREAVRASVLSSRWRYLWPRRTQFEFNAVTMLDAHILEGRPHDGEEAYNLTKGKTGKFIRSVYSVMQQLEGAQVDELKFRYFLDNSHSHHLDAWVRFAVAAKTRVLRMHLFRPYSKSRAEIYNFPCHLLRHAPFMELISLMNCSIRLPCNFDGFGHLKKLFLILVDISQEDFDNILFNCSHTLTKLVVWCAQNLVSITPPCLLSQLELLWVEDCPLLRKIEINAVNLLQVDYEGTPMDFKFRQSSKLNKAHIFFKTERTMNNPDFYLTKLSSSLPHIQSLSLKISVVSEVADLPEVSGRFAYLVHLDCKWGAGLKMSLFHLDTLLDVAPSLKELNLCFSERSVEQPPKAPHKFRQMLHKHPHSHLKTVQLRNFYFDTWQIEIAAYLLANFTELESMMIEKGSKPSWFASKETFDMGTEILSQHVPANVRLVIL